MSRGYHEWVTWNATIMCQCPDFKVATQLLEMTPRLPWPSLSPRSTSFKLCCRVFIESLAHPLGIRYSIARPWQAWSMTIYTGLTSRSFRRPVGTNPSPGQRRWELSAARCNLFPSAVPYWDPDPLGGALHNIQPCPLGLLKYRPPHDKESLWEYG